MQARIGLRLFRQEPPQQQQAFDQPPLLEITLGAHGLKSTSVETCKSRVQRVLAHPSLRMYCVVAGLLSVTRSGIRFFRAASFILLNRALPAGGE